MQLVRYAFVQSSEHSRHPIKWAQAGVLPPAIASYHYIKARGEALLITQQRGDWAILHLVRLP